MKYLLIREVTIAETIEVIASSPCKAKEIALNDEDTELVKIISNDSAQIKIISDIIEIK